MVTPKRTLIWSAQSLPYFITDIKIRSMRVEVYKTELKKDSINNIGLFQEILSERFCGYTDIYTDASKSREPNLVGYGVWIPTQSEKICGRLPDHWSVYSAETFAICRAIQVVIDKNISKAVIISDALGVLSKLKTGKIDANIDIITVNVLSLLARAKSSGLRIALMWIPSHSYIAHNDTADMLANRGRSLPGQSQLKGDPRELWPEYRNKLWDEWTEEFKRIGMTKGRMYASVVRPNDFRGETWYKTLSCPRSSITTIIRIRSGHCSTPAHLARIGVMDSSMCRCGEIGDLPHVFFSCSDNSHNVNELIRVLLALGFQAPLSLSEVFYSTRPEVMNLLIEFLYNSRIRL